MGHIEPEGKLPGYIGRQPPQRLANGYLAGPSHGFLLDPIASTHSPPSLLCTLREEARGHFRPVYANEILTLNCAEREQFDNYHYCSRQVQPVKDSPSG